METIYHSRMKKLQKFISQSKLDALIVDNVIDLFYLTGIELSLGRLFVSKSDATLFVDGRYYQACKSSSPFPLRLDDWRTSQAKWLSQAKQEKLKLIAFDKDNTSYSTYEKLKDLLAKSMPPAVT